MENKKNAEFLKKHEKVPERIPKVPKKSKIFQTNANVENNLSKISTLANKALYFIPNKLEVELIKHSNKLKSTGIVRPEERRTTLEVLVSLSDKAEGFMKFSIIKQMLLSFYSGVYVCTGVMLAIFLSTGMPYLGVQAFLTAFGLCSGLVMSGLTGSALFTEQNVILPVNLVKFRKSVFKTMRFWIISFIGNCVGCAFMGFMFNLALCVRNNEIQQRLGSILNSKLQHMEFGTFGWWGILLSGILGNTILGTGVIMGNMSRDVPGKVIAMFIGVVSFVATGTDHCMANIGFFSIGLFHEYFFEGENFNVPRLNISNVFLWNIVPTFIGNIVGSFIFVSAAYSFIFSSNHVVKGLEKQNGPVKKELPKKPRFLSLAQTEKLLTPNVSARNSVKSPNIRSGTKKFAEISPKL